MQPEPSIRSADVLVIGLGSTGCLALAAARDAGASVLGLDQMAEPASGAIDGCSYGTRVWGIFSDGTVAASSAAGTTRYTARAVIVATGGIDLPLPLPGWELPGVSGAFQAARELDDGTEAVVLRGPNSGLAGRVPDLGRLRVTLDHDLMDGPAVTIDGGDRVESVTIGGVTTPAQHVLLDNGLQPENVLARMTGVPSVFSAANGGDVIETGSVVALRGTLLTVVGDASGISAHMDEIEHEAVEAGRMLAESTLGGPIPVAIRDPPLAWQAGGAPRLAAQSTDDTLLCPDEGITIGEAREAIRRGATTVNDVKRRTRAAMAACQGRDCLWTIRALLAEAERDHLTPMTARPPATGISLAELASIAIG